jgi:serine/threonine-protein kinase
VDDDASDTIDETLAELDGGGRVRLDPAGLKPAEARGGDFSLPPVSASSQPSGPVSVRAGQLDEGFDDHGEIGRGGMGKIHFVRDRSLMREMALKTLPPRRGPSTDPVNRFIEEAQITGQLDHPNIVPVHQLGIDEEGGYFFTMKLVRGKTLKNVLDELGPRRLSVQNLERIIGIVGKICDALAFAHSRGVIHRDLKPSNIMVGSYGQVYVMDWGLAHLPDVPRAVHDGKKVLGTPTYMPPEQALGETVDERADVYGVGGLLYRALTAQPPHPGETRQASLFHALTEPVAPPESVTEGELPPELCRIAMKALARDPEDRYRDVTSLRADLDAFQHGGGWLATRVFEAGELVIRKGEDAREAFIILEGRCESFEEVDGRRETFRKMGPGEVFGETALLTSHRRTADVRAVTDLRVKVVTRDSLERELERSAWMRALFHSLADRFRDLDAILREVLAQDK